MAVFPENQIPCSFCVRLSAIFEKSISSGETYIVDAGHMVAFEENVTYTIKKAAKGFFSTIASGEGLVCHFTGQGKLWVQNRNLKGFAATLAKLMPRSS